MPAYEPDRRGPWAWVLPRRLLFFLDLLATATACLVAWQILIQWRWLDPSVTEASAVSHGALLGGISVVMFIGLLWNGAFSTQRRISRVDDGLLLLKHLIIAACLVTFVAFVSKGFGTGFTDYSRRVVFAYVVLVVVLTTGAGFIAWAWQSRLFNRGQGVRRLVIAGAGAAAAEFERFLRKRTWLGVRCAGVIAILDGPTAQQRLGGMVLTAPILGRLGDLDRVVAATFADEVVVALDEDERAVFPELAIELVARDIPFRVLPNLFEIGYAPACAAGLNGLPMVALRVGPAEDVRRAAKRTLDVLVAGALLLFLSPLLLVVSMLIKLTSSGPVLFRQVRVGREGRRFDMLKFRSMYVDAEARIGDVAALNDGEDALFKIRDDPRVTRVGRFLRRWSLDEVPQFVNVLRGEMSIVGPRPPLPREVSLYEVRDLVRLKGKPGITGLWQVSGRSDLTFEQMVDLDRYYLEHWSLGLDVSIMVRTIKAVVRRNGAY